MFNDENLFILYFSILRGLYSASRLQSKALKYDEIIYIWPGNHVMLCCSAEKPFLPTKSKIFGT